MRDPSEGYHEDVQFALLRYTTWNIGDEIQSLAARQFLPRVDLYIDRDRIGTEASRLTRPTKAVLNSWWIHGADWPPRGQTLRPLLTSMYLDHRHPVARQAFLSPESLEFFATSAPVGARDLSTLAFLSEHGVPAFFSGCLTLTLLRDPEVPRQEYVLAVDLPPDAVAELRRRTSRTVVVLSTYHEPGLGITDRMRLAELFLLFYQSAAAVVTTRLHAVLPATALETPALLVTTRETFDADRFSGLVELVRSCTVEDLPDLGGHFDLDNPSPNPPDYRPLRAALSSSCRKFTGVAPSVIETGKSLSDPRSIEGIAQLLGDQIIKARAGRELVDTIKAQGARPGPLVRTARRAWRLWETR